MSRDGSRRPSSPSSGRPDEEVAPTGTEASGATGSPRVDEPVALRVVALAAAFVAGGLIAAQARINGGLGAALGDGLVAASYSFVSGWVVIAIVLLVSRKGRAGLAVLPGEVRSRRLSWPFLLGGAAGASLVFSQTIVVTLVGVALFTIAVVAGQTISGIVIDTRGIGSAPPVALTPRRLAGAAIVVVAVVLSVGSGVTSDAPLGFLALPLVAGFAIGWQQAVNAQVRRVSGSPVTATFVNFTVGSLVLVIATVVHLAIAGMPHPGPLAPWLFVGGVIGVVFIGANSVIVPVVGVLAQALAAVAGQLVFSLVLGVVAPGGGAPVTVLTVVGAALVLVGVIVVTWRPRRAAAPGAR